MLLSEEYEMTVGLEVHAELRTQSKIFCACSTAFGAPPNTQCCPVCLGLPGALPTLNRRAVELAVMAGLALRCQIASVCRMDRKQYFYPDLPKGFQTSQTEHPICRDGMLEWSQNGEVHRVKITRIHIEEDAGKLMHEGGVTQVDCNRCGVPLIEIVSAPELHSGEEAAAYLRELRAILQTCGISDCKMQEGSLRCDVNLSIRKKGEPTLGTRTEIKNVNSFSFVQKAIDYEAARQQRELEETGAVKQQTMRFLPDSGRTEPMRQKEQAEDYRYFPDPDLLPFSISCETIERLRASLPELPAACRTRLCRQYALTEAEAGILTATLGLTAFYEAAVADGKYPRETVNLLLNELLRHCTEEPFFSPVSPQRLRELAELWGEGSINYATAKKLLVRLTERDFSPRTSAEKEQLLQIRDPALIGAWIDEILKQNSAAVQDYLGGKIHALRALQGKLMARSQGRADPILSERLLLEAIQNHPQKEESTHV